MKTVIFAGGWGTRLGQISERIPKPMVQVGGLPILQHLMGIYAHQGFKDFVICLGVKGDVVRNWVTNFHSYRRDFTMDLATGGKTFHTRPDPIDWKVTLVETGLNTQKGGRLKRVETYLDGEDAFLTYGDGLANVDLNRLLAFHRSHGKLLTITGVNPPSRFGELEERNGRVTSFQEKPSGTTGLVNGGFMVFKRRLLDWLTTDEDCDLEYGAMRELALRGQVMMFKHDGDWACVDHERDILHLEQLLQQKKAFWLPESISNLSSRTAPMALEEGDLQ